MIWIILAFVLGGMFGMVTACICAAAGQSDRSMENELHSMENK